MYKLYVRKQGSYFVKKVYPKLGLEHLDKRVIEKARIMALIRNKNHLWDKMDNEELIRSPNMEIPVCAIILKKKRPLGEAILINDASHNFVKEGKQNCLLEKDIARIVDVYAQKIEIEGDSHLSSRQEIIENEHN